MPSKEETLIGTLEKILYSNPENGFIIGTFLTNDTVIPVTVKGIVYNNVVHETLNLKGNWENHKIYGRQFSFHEFMTVQPTSEEGMIRYLSSEIFKGIGKKTAQRIVNKFGNDTFNIIDSSPELISKIKGITKKQHKSLLNSWEMQKGLREVMTFLRGIGISHSFALKIYAKYGMNSISLIKSNPYLLTEIPGIGFLKADGIALNIGVDKNSPYRASAGLLYMFEQQVLNGHTCYPLPDLLGKTASELLIDQQTLEESINQMLEDEQILGLLFCIYMVYCFHLRLSKLQIPLLELQRQCKSLPTEHENLL